MSEINKNEKVEQLLLNIIAKYQNLDVGNLKAIEAGLSGAVGGPSGEESSSSKELLEFMCTQTKEVIEAEAATSYEVSEDQQLEQLKSGISRVILKAFI